MENYGRNMGNPGSFGGAAKTSARCRVTNCKHHGGGEKCMLNDILVNFGTDSCSICQDFAERM